MNKGNLKVIVLHLIQKEPMTGYGLLNKCDKPYGKEPSTGTMYPLLESFEKQGFLKLEIEGRRKVYSITAKGKKYHKSLVKEINDNYKALIKLGVIEDYDNVEKK